MSAYDALAASYDDLTRSSFGMDWCRKTGGTPDVSPPLLMAAASISSLEGEREEMSCYEALAGSYDALTEDVGYAYTAGHSFLSFRSWTLRFEP